MDLWDKIKIDYEFLGLSFDQLSEKYDVEKDRIELRSQLEEWVDKSKGSHWPELFQRHQNVDTRIEMLEYLLHESTYQKAYELEHEIYQRLLDILGNFDSNLPITALDTLRLIIKEYSNLKNIRLKVLEAFQESPVQPELNPQQQGKGLLLEEVLEEIHDVDELEYLRSLVKRIEEKRSFETDRQKDGRDLASSLH